MLYSLDVETSGLSPYLGDRPFLVTWATEDGSNAAFIGQDDLTQLTFTLDKQNEFVFHNAAFDIPMLAQYGLVPCGTLHDTLIAAHVYNPLEPNKSLKALAKKYLKRENVEEQKLEEWFCKNKMRGKDSREYIKVPAEIIVPYAKADVEMTLGLFNFYKSHGVIDDQIYKLEMQLLPVCIDIVKRGMKVDIAFAKREARRTSEIASALGERLRTEFQLENPGSEAQLADLLFKRSGLECKKLTDKGNPRLDEAALLEYEHPAIEPVLEYREAIKMNSTYLQPMINKLDKEDRLHASLNQTGARTGRFSSSNPNLQNIPRSGGLVNVREGFATRGEGWDLFLVDLSQIELRVLAHYSKEPAMLDALRTREGDLHAATAKLLFSSEEKKYRTIAKTLNFATIYGAGAKQLLRTLSRSLPDAGFTLDQVKSFKSEYFRAYPAVREFIWKVEGFIRERAATNPDRVGWIADVYGRKYFCEADAAYRAVNYLIQGCSANLFKTSMIKVFAFLQERKARSGLINVIHDEFIFDLHESEHGLVPEIVGLIEDLTKFRVPIFSNAFISHTNWAAKQAFILPPLVQQTASPQSRTQCSAPTPVLS